MGEKLVVGPVNRGLQTNRTAFVIDNDSFPTLINAYQWRGRIKRKRGTDLLGRLQRQINLSTPTPLATGWLNLFGFIGLAPNSIFITNISSSINAVVTYILVAGADYQIGEIIQIVAVTGMTEINDGYYKILNKVGNTLILDVNSTGFSPYIGGGIVGLVSNSMIVPGSISFSDGVNTYTEPLIPDHTLLKNGLPTIDSFIFYSTGIILINGLAPPANITGVFSYYPGLPVMGLEDLLLQDRLPGTLAFDTTYSYNIQPTSPYTIYDVSFYKNPLLDPINLPGYIPKSTPTPLTWNGQDYRQFWTVNYQNALWATNGMEVPFNGSTLSMQFAPASTITWIATNPHQIQVQITNCPLVEGDFVFVNEWSGPGLSADTLNFQTGYVVKCVPNTPTLATKLIDITFPFANLTVAVYTPGIIQYLTNQSDPTKDCLRWYDGDPTSAAGKGWVNFCPPLSQLNYSIDDLPPAQYYLISAKIIFPFKDRLLFFGPVIQTSTAGSQVYLQDTVIYSQNGTAFYTASFTGNFLVNTFSGILLPKNQSASPSSYFEDQTGFGGFETIGIEQPITGVSPNEDALIVELNTVQTRCIYSGNDIVPFNFYVVNSELGCSSTFSVINMDEGVISRGDRGIIITNQTSSKRIDLEIPDQVFEMNLTNNGRERITAQRDFINEWIYFTYPSNENSYIYPTQTLQFNYRDNSWAIFNESYTTYGQFKKQTGETWLTLGYSSWIDWNEPWMAGTSTLLQPKVIAGNQQGFVLILDQGTSEGNSLFIESISGSTITSTNHCLNDGDYIVISECVGTISSLVNGKIFSVVNPNTNTFLLNPSIGSGSYLGNGLIKRMYIPRIQTKQFPVAWNMARKTRIGVQQYLFTTTPSGQIQLLIFLSQDSSNAFNDNSMIPNGSLIYSTLLYTCPEGTNLGLTPANINLQIPTASTQSQTWHRMNTSLIGDSVQIGFTLSDSQMRDINFKNQFAEIELHGFILDIQPSQILV